MIKLYRYGLVFDKDYGQMCLNNYATNIRNKSYLAIEVR
jgi:hypothetical protein